MSIRCLVGSFFLFAPLDLLNAIEFGDLVAARRHVSIEAQGVTVDRVGPGQVLRVLSVNGTKISVSRGRPGWLDSTNVIALDQAEEFFNRPFATGAGSREYLARGTVRIALGNPTEGIADLKKAVEIAYDPGEYLEPLGYAQLAANQQPDAVETFTQAIEDEPNSAPALMGRGLAYYQVGQNRKAYDDLLKAIELDPQHAFPRKYIGAVLHDLGKLELAEKQLRVAARIDTHDAFTHKALGRLLYDQADYQTALNEFAAAIKLDPIDVEAITGRGVARHAIGTDLQAAKSDFLRAVELSEEIYENAFLWSNLGQVEMELGETDEAMRNLDRAIELDTEFTEARSHRAFLVVSESTEATAIEAAKSDVRAVFASIDPRTFWDYRALAAVNAAIGDYSRAAKYQTLGEAILRKTGPRRFIPSAVATRQEYEQRQSRS